MVKSYSPRKLGAKQDSVASSLQCHDSDFVTDKADSNIIRGINKERLMKRSLIVDAVPAVFPGLPSYLCKGMPPK